MRSRDLCGLCVLAAMVTVPTPFISANLTSSIQAPTSHVGVPVRSSRRTIHHQVGRARREQFLQGRSNKFGWLLDPEVFDVLSSAGRNAALLMNGLLRPPESPAVLPRMEGPQAARQITPQQITPGQNIIVDDPSKDGSSHTHNETSIAVNGSNIIETFNDLDSANRARYAYSTDGGNSWTDKRVPPPAANAMNDGDGVAVFGAEGEIYYSGLCLLQAAGSITWIVEVAKSVDGGATFSTPVNASASISNNSDLQDKPWTAVDKGVSSPFRGTLYVCWTTFTRPLPSNQFFINVARSTDGGATFRKPVVVSPGVNATGAMPAIAPNGDLYVAFEDFSVSPGGIDIVKSTDGGLTFSRPKNVANVNPISTMTGGNGVRDNGYPRVAVDNKGAIHIVFSSALRLFGQDRSDVRYVRSTDGGATFSPSVFFNDDGTTTAQWLPCIAAAPDGTLGARWWDRRNDPAGDSLTDVYMAVSTDGGMSWSKNFRLTDHNWVFGPEEAGFGSSYHGDYDDIAADSTNFYVTWSDERGALPSAYFSFVPLSHDPASPDFNISAAKVYDGVAAGNSVEFDLNTSALNGFSNNLTLSISSPAIDGVSFNFESSSISPGTQAKLTASTSSSAVPGTYLISATATGGGLTRSTNFRLTVYSAERIASVPANITHTRGFTSIQGGFQIDSSGLAHIAFDDDTPVANRGSAVFYSQSGDGARTFSVPTRISTNSDDSFNSTLAIDGAGRIYAAWTSPNPGTNNGRIFISRSSDNGHTFSAPLAVSPPSGDADSARIAADKNGSVHVIFLMDLSTTRPLLFHVLSNDGGASFSGPIQVSGNGEDVFSADLALDSTGAAYVVYFDASSIRANLRLAVAPDGQHFGGTSIISPDSSNFDTDPSLAIDANDKLTVVFAPIVGITTSSPVGQIQMVQSCDKGKTFGPQVVIANGTVQADFPAVAVDSKGGITVACRTFSTTRRWTS